MLGTNHVVSEIDELYFSSIQSSISMFLIFLMHAGPVLSWLLTNSWL